MSFLGLKVKFNKVLKSLVGVTNPNNPLWQGNTLTEILNNIIENGVSGSAPVWEVSYTPENVFLSSMYPPTGNTLDQTGRIFTVPNGSSGFSGSIEALPLDATLRGFQMQSIDTTAFVNGSAVYVGAVNSIPFPTATAGALIVLTWDGVDSFTPAVGDPFAPILLPSGTPFTYNFNTDKLTFAIKNDGTVNLYKNNTLVHSDDLSASPIFSDNSVACGIYVANPDGTVVTLPSTPTAVTGVTFWTLPGANPVLPSNREGKSFIISGLPTPTYILGGLYVDGNWIFFDTNGDVSPQENIGQEITQAQADSLYEPKKQHNYNGGTTVPGSNDDISQGYSIGSKWYLDQLSPKEVYVCTNDMLGGAEWELITLGIEDLGTAAVVNIGSSSGEVRTNQSNEALFSTISQLSSKVDTSTFNSSQSAQDAIINGKLTRDYFVVNTNGGSTLPINQKYILINHSGANVPEVSLPLGSNVENGAEYIVQVGNITGDTINFRVNGSEPNANFYENDGYGNYIDSEFPTIQLNGKSGWLMRFWWDELNQIWIKDIHQKELKIDIDYKAYNGTATIKRNHRNITIANYNPFTVQSISFPSGLNLNNGVSVFSIIVVEFDTSSSELVTSSGNFWKPDYAGNYVDTGSSTFPLNSSHVGMEFRVLYTGTKYIISRVDGTPL